MPCKLESSREFVARSNEKKVVAKVLRGTLFSYAVLLCFTRYFSLNYAVLLLPRQVVGQHCKALAMEVEGLGWFCIFPLPPLPEARVCGWLGGAQEVCKWLVGTPGAHEEQFSRLFDRCFLFFGIPLGFYPGRGHTIPCPRHMPHTLHPSLGRPHGTRSFTHSSAHNPSSPHKLCNLLTKNGQDF